MLFQSLTVAILSATALAVPTASTTRSCSLSNAKLTVPSGQTQLVAPSGAPSFVAWAIGVQNYTCNGSAYTSAGAVAQLFDASCLVGTAKFDTIQTTAFNAWNKSPKTTSAAQVIIQAAAVGKSLNSGAIVGQHYFVTNPVSGTGLSPKWDFSSSGATAGNANAFVVAAKAGYIASPDGSSNVDWLSLNNVAGQGKLATQIFRTDTVSGQPPASCTAGSADISVKYASKYWLYGSSL